MKRLILIALILSAAACAKNRPLVASRPPLVGDEGMWTLNNLPVDELKARYNFVPTPQWIQHVQLSAVRFNDGGSGTFVSAEGLVITNHHVALGQLQKLSTAEHNYARDGFFARSRNEELKCPDLELNVLMSMDDVTQRVNAAIDTKASQEQQNRQRKAEISRIEKESHEKTRLRSDVISLYQGGEYWLYRYKKYTDVRIVMAAELQAAFFGGDYDNFCYPRFCLDFAFFRVYEKGQPLHPEHFLRWNSNGVKEGDLVFVAGNPGSTARLRTVAQLEYERDFALPTMLRMAKDQRGAMREYAALGAEQARQVMDDLYGYENWIKAMEGQYEGLKDPAVFARLVSAENALRKQVRTSSLSPSKGEGRGEGDAVSQRKALESVDDAWSRIADAMKKSETRLNQNTYYRLRGSELLNLARTIVFNAVESQKPNDQRYEEYRDSNRESLEFELFSPAPIYPQLEEHTLTFALHEAMKHLGPDDKLVKAALDGRDPKSIAHDLISRTKLAEPEFRKTLVKGGLKAVEASDDPLVVFARNLEPIWRELRDWNDNNIQSVLTIEGAKIARARFAIWGHKTYPDATFTLRLSFGRALGYEQLTTLVPWKTTFLGLYDRAASFDNKPPFDLSAAEKRARSTIDLNTPLNIVTTNDIIGGNSGSPVINRNAEYVGLIFDGNIQSLVADYVYTDKQARAVAVHSAAIVEALRKIYDMPSLADELTK